MKKLLFITAMLFGLMAQAQKKFEVYNFTTITIEIYDIITDASGSFPEFHGKGTPIIIPPGGTYTLTNPANIFRFPFHSPTSVPYIGSWTRVNPPGTFTSPVAWTMGNAQVFKAMPFGETGVSLGYISVTTPTVSYTGPGTAWDAVYDMFVNPSNPNDITYTVVIF